MDVYHRVLNKLYEAADGKDTKVVDFKELVKSLGFHGNYPDIFERLSREGWIAEDKKADFVRLTHWGAAEVKTPSDAANQASRNLTANANKAKAEFKELSLLFEVFTGNPSKENLAVVEKKVANLQTIINQIKLNLQ